MHIDSNSNNRQQQAKAKVLIVCFGFAMLVAGSCCVLP
jgi:hypothetical protein